jgi:hypothetical protein
MDDPLARLLVVATAAALIGAWAFWRRRRQLRRSWRAIWATGMDPGTYLFTSSTCGECVEAREKIGRVAHTEVSWEEQPELFERLGVAEVPSTLVVMADGTGVLHRGVPGETLKRRNP